MERKTLPVRIGTVLYGSLGQFGHGGTFRVEAVGADWVVARPLQPFGGSAEPVFAPYAPEFFEECTVPNDEA